MSERAVEFHRLRALFDRIADLPFVEREAEIVRSTDGDTALESELRALLDYADRFETTLDSPLLSASWPDLPLPSIPGYQVHRRIGRGGSATVYAADQERDDFTRTVALKVVDHIVDSTSLWRVREEQRILARLEHAGIARLYDTGVTSHGQPYLAMEHVQGETIVEHCRSRQLPIRARIELFLSVLDAVGYAHEQGIVHRDLKPANILVSGRGEAKLLDFGIARLIAADDGNETRTLHRALTPAYASPEQLRGGRITPASDIYSLGVVLYELLANTLPFQLDERVFDPQPPSEAFASDALSAKEAARWRKAVRGDLDAVVLKALRHNAEDRYPSAAAMAADLRRVLAGRSVARTFRIGRFVRRHRISIAAVAAAAVVTLLIAIWPSATSGPPSGLAIFYEAGLRDGAQKLERFDAFAARDSFREAAASSRGRMPDEALAWDGVARAESELGEVGKAAEAAKRADGLITANVDLPDDEVQRMRAAAHAANYDWAKAIPALESLFARLPERVDIGMALVNALLDAGRTDAADTVLGRVRQLPQTEGDPRIDLLEADVAQQLSEYQRAAAAAARTRARALQLGATAIALRAEGVHAEALMRLDRRDEAKRALESLIPRTTAAGLPRETAAAQMVLGNVLLRIGTAEETRQALEKAVAGFRAAGDARGHIAARVVLAMYTGKQGEFAEAIAMIERCVADARRIGDRWSEGYALSQKLTLHNWADDEPAFRATVEPALTALRDSGNRQLLMNILSNLAIVDIEGLDLDKAEERLAESESLARRVGNTLAHAKIDRSRGYLAQTRGDHAFARERYKAALEKARRAAVPLSIGTYLGDLASLELADDRPEAAEVFAKQALDVLTAAGDRRLASEMEEILAWTAARRGDFTAAERHLDVVRARAAKDGTDNLRFRLFAAEARVARVRGDWRRVIELRRESVRIAAGWGSRGLVLQQQLHLAEALNESGDRRAMEKLAGEMLPEAERLGLRGIVRELQAMLGS